MNYAIIYKSSLWSATRPSGR